jgi:hypothetical protein
MGKKGVRLWALGYRYGVWLFSSGFYQAAEHAGDVVAAVFYGGEQGLANVADFMSDGYRSVTEVTAILLISPRRGESL